MKLVAILLAFASIVVTQDLGNLPDCAKSCLAEYTTGNKIGDCARLDAKCICASDTFISGIACCLAGVCNADEQQQAVDFARSFCSTQGVTDLPQSVTCATASPSSSSSSPASTPTSGSTNPTVAGTPSATVTPNAALPSKSGANAGLFGGVLAALAML
ncbi:hypothetical protein F5B22DRAFT_269768 [Xylaria bambusicola]|uniref:uncharacterized protein n=1 Tax=Xylaria bambusicola TaxID=326684 RepID=UPI0020081983|nr:uncharacterized protein F5B22DRAFT_269768 [Xylaria bambusicola]KAI0526125.1 hypothetical protein F5B22DRAFT_269768 [Xylaria bambusicola]